MILRITIPPLLSKIGQPDCQLLLGPQREARARKLDLVPPRAQPPDVELGDQRQHEHLHLHHREGPADAHPGPVVEALEGVGRGRGALAAVPPVRVERRGVGAPYVRVEVHDVRAQLDGRVFGEECARYGHVVLRLSGNVYDCSYP